MLQVRTTVAFIRGTYSFWNVKCQGYVSSLSVHEPIRGRGTYVQLSYIVVAFSYNICNVFSQVIAEGRGRWKETSCAILFSYTECTSNSSYPSQLISSSYLFLCILFLPLPNFSSLLQLYLSQNLFLINLYLLDSFVNFCKSVLSPRPLLPRYCPYFNTYYLWSLCPHNLSSIHNSLIFFFIIQLCPFCTGMSMVSTLIEITSAVYSLSMFFQIWYTNNPFSWTLFNSYQLHSSFYWWL